MNTAYKIENKIFLKFPYNQGIIGIIKTIPDRWYHPDKKEWSVPFTRLQELQDKVIIPYKFKAEGFDLVEEIKTPISVNTKPVQEIDFFDLSLKLQPRPYQIEGIDFCLQKKFVINGSDMGVGKTAMSILSVLSQKLYPCLIITPSSVKYNWANEFSKWTNNIPTISIVDSNVIEDKQVVIINYDRLFKNIVTLNNIRWKCIIADEFHNLKNAKAKKTHAVRDIIRSSKPEYIQFLSGTPIMNRPSELITPLTLLGKFKEVGNNWKYFVERYCNAKSTRFGWDISGASNTLELNQKLQKSCYFRVNKRDVLTELPPIQETILNFELSNQKEYNRAMSDLVEFLTEAKGQQAADNALAAEHLVLMSTLRQLSSLGKLESIFEWIDDFLESSEEKLVIFGVFKESLKEISKRYNCKLIDGSVNAENKFKMIREFAKNSDRILCGNIQSLGTGTDGLQESCSCMLVIDLPWRPSDIDQTISRLERSGQKNNINVYFPLASSIDIEMWDLISNKRKITDAVNKGIDTGEQVSISKELIERLIKK